jgi:type VI secretion system protein VasJ
VSPVASELVTGLLQPIPGPHPCGAVLDIDVDEDFLFIQDEIEKTGAFASGEVDWAGILDRSTRLLAGRSKDWGLACYVVRGLYHRGGCAGLLAGLEFLHESVQRYWKEMHPLLPAGTRKRVNLFEWLITGLADDLTRKAPGASEAETLKSAREMLLRLDALLGENLGAAHPGARVLREALERSERQAAPAAETAPGTTSERVVESGSPVAAAAPAEFPPPIDNPDVADVVLSRCRQGIFAACDSLHGQDTSAARPYRLRRIAAWMNFTEIPPSEEGRIAAAGPDEGEAARLRDVLARDPKGVLNEAEGRLQIHPLWLDLQQMACAALERLGPSHHAARQTVIQETRAFLGRFAGLRDLQFENGVPLADETTLAFIDRELREEEPAGPAPAAVQGNDRLAEAVARAEELAGRGEIEKSLEVFHHGLRTISGGRERFLWRLATARHCARLGQTALALDLLDGLDGEGADRGLEAWEPELSAEVLQTALQLGKKGRARKGPPIPMVTERMPELNKRLARLDLLAALRMTSKEH